MPRSEKQKTKLFRLLEILMQRTDETHGLTMPEIISALSEYGISAERKSIYDDIITLGELGFDVITLPTRPPKYSLNSRPFDIAELKILADAVASSKFVTREKSRALIEKLKGFAGGSHRSEFSREVYVEDRVKTMNDSSLLNVDKIHRAISENKKISFGYFDFGVDKKKHFRRGGARYEVSPVALVWSDENYYLVGYDEADGQNKHFRVDKMDGVFVTELPKSREASAERFNGAEYSKKVFGMYGGREELVTLECRERLAGVIIDRFGDGQSFIKTDFGFRVALRVMISPNFFGWVLGFGSDMRILSPETVKNELVTWLSGALEMYDEKI